MLKIEAVAHFIDAWSGQTMWLKVGTRSHMTIVWTDTFDFTQTRNALNLCGSDIGEGKFSVPLQAIVSKDLLGQGKEIVIEIGSTLDADPCYASYGISALRLFTR